LNQPCQPVGGHSRTLAQATPPPPGASMERLRDVRWLRGHSAV